jgi:DNA-binding transcriptional ArsR family regulator
MKAVSHPVRLALLEVLSLRGPLTATEAGRLIDETPTTCSFHLRQLARWGLRRRGRQQTVWWVTSEELGAVLSELDALVQRHWERLTDPAKRPAGAMPVEFISLTHVFDALVDEALVDQEPERRDGDGQGR